MTKRNLSLVIGLGILLGTGRARLALAQDSEKTFEISGSASTQEFELDRDLHPVEFVTVSGSCVGGGQTCGFDVGSGNYTCIPNAPICTAPQDLPLASDKVTTHLSGRVKVIAPETEFRHSLIVELTASGFKLRPQTDEKYTDEILIAHVESQKVTRLREGGPDSPEMKNVDAVIRLVATSTEKLAAPFIAKNKIRGIALTNGLVRYNASELVRPDFLEFTLKIAKERRFRRDKNLFSGVVPAAARSLWHSGDRTEVSYDVSQIAPRLALEPGKKYSVNVGITFRFPDPSYYFVTNDGWSPAGTQSAKSEVDLR